MPIQNTGQDLRLRGNSGDGVTDIKEEISNDPYTGEASLGTLNTVRYATVAEGSVVTGRAMSEMQGYSAFTGALPQTEATGALGESLYFNSSDEIVYLDRDADFTNTNTTGTFSFWLKRNDPDNADATIYSSGDNQTNRVWIRYNSSGSVTDKNLQVVATTSNSTKIQLVYDAPFLDTASWYHVVVAIDTTKNYQYDRVRTYVNGIELKDLETGTKSAIWPSQNDAIKFNNNQRIGDPIWVTGYSSNMVIADFKFIENKQLRPDSFGKLLNGIWIPQAYAASDDTEITSNLIAKYDFINNANDTSGSATTYNGSASNVTYYRNNYHIADFNGSSSVIEVPSKIPASLDFSISFWFNSTSTYAHSYIFSTKHNSVTNGWWIVFNRTTGAGTINYGEGNGSLNATTAETSINTLGDGDWHHAVVTRATGGIVNIYIDGVHDVVNHSVGSGYMTSSTWHDNLHIGKYAGTNALYYDGYLGEAQVYTDVLTPDEALQQYNATKHKYAYGINGFWLPLNNTSTGSIDSSSNLKLHLDASDSSSYSGSGTNWNDLTSNNNDGTISGANYLSSTNGGVFNFDGSNDSVSISGQIPNSLSSNYTVEALFNADTINSTGGTIFKNWFSSGAYVAGTGELRVHNYNGNKLRWYSVTGNGSSTVQVYDTTINLDISKWYHAVLIADASGGAPTLYLNGILTAIPSLVSTYFTSPVSNSHIGGNSQGSAYFDGKIAQVRVYDKALTANEAITNYRAIQGNYEQVNTVDISGNANSFTPTSTFSYTDHTKDQPLDNYATLNLSEPFADNFTFSEGNTKFTSAVNGYHTSSATMALNSGKWYVEFKFLGSSAYGSARIGPAILGDRTGINSYGGTTNDSWMWGSNGAIYHNNSNIATSSVTATTNDIIGFAIDLDNHRWFVSKNGSWQYSHDPATPSTGIDISGFTDYFIGFHAYTSSDIGQFDFGQNGFTYTPPGGFKAMSSKNLPAPTFDPDGVIQDKPSNYFKAVTYQGTGAQQGSDYGFIEGSRAAVFNGSNSYITVNDKLTPSSGAFSISWWMNWNGDADYAYVFDNGGGSAGNGLYCIAHDSVDTLYFGFKNGGTLFQSNSGAPSIEKNTWIHWCLTWDGTTGTDKFKVYKNGVATSFTSTVANTTPAYNFRIGEQNGTGGEHINARIDDLRVYHDVLTPDEVGYLYNNTTASIPSDNLEAHYKFDGNANDKAGSFGSLVSSPKINLDVDGYTSGSVSDLSGNGNTATVTGATYGTDSNGNGYFDLDGSSDYLQISASTDFNSATNFTLEGWFNPDNLTAVDHLFSIYGTSANRKLFLRLYNSSGDLAWQTYNSSGNTAGHLDTSNANARVAANKWNHVAVTHINNGSMEVFVNGVSAGTASSTGINTTGTDDLYIGTLNTYIGTYDFDGKVSDVRFYDSALSSAQVVQNFNASKGSYGVGNDGTESNITYTQDKSYGNIDVGFAPDLVWVKVRDASASHALIDSVRGNSSVIYSNLPSGEAISSASNDIVSFDSNGFTLGTDQQANANTNGNDIVAWAWKAGGAAVSNTDGDITSSVSANQDAGFSIVKWNSSSTASDTIGSGLNERVEFLLTKKLNGSRDWHVWHKDLPNNGYLSLNSGISEATPNGNRATVTNNNTFIAESTSGDSMIAYCFHSVDGFSKFGSYSGNGSSNGPFIYTGFKPAWLMVKWTNDPNSNSSWVIYDNARNTVNEVDTSLRSNNTSADSTVSTRDFLFLSNGFKVDGNSGTINDSSGNYIYMAFAEDPVKYSNGVATLGDGNEFIQDGNYPEDNFNTTLYTGTGAATKISTGLNADFVWAKTRSFSATTSHRLVDTLRGPKNHLYLPNTLAQTFDSAGITIENDGFSFAGNEGANLSGRSTVAWSWKAGGLINKAAVFNGSSSFIQTSLSLNTASNTVSFWFNADSVGSQKAALYFNNRGGRIDITINGTSSNTATVSYENILINSTTAITGWNFVSIVFTGWAASYTAGSYGSAITANVYLNGGSAVSLSPTPYGQSDGLRIGRSGGGYYYDGKIDQVRIFNKALSTNNGGTNEIEKLYNETAADLDTLQILGDTSCIAAYKLGEDAIDLSGNYNGTASNVTFNLPGHLTRNNKGTVESEVSANQTNGFSIVKYTGNDVNGQSIGHGLGAPPEFIIIKCLTLATNWMVYTLPTGNDQKLYLNLSDGQAATGNMNSQTPTHDVFFVGGGNETGDLDDNYIAYCWHSVPGFSKIGSYTGNTTAEIYTGFEPKWIMIKRTDRNGDDWHIFDSSRSGTAPSGVNGGLVTDNLLKANTTDNEADGGSNRTINFNPTGFNWSATGSGAVNASGGTYIYMAFAHR